MKERIVIGTRGSKLALYQANWTAEVIRAAYPQKEVVIKEIKTKGDKILDVALSRIGDKGLFVKELENELLSGEIDLAVHSMKDLPTELTAGLALGAVSKREDVRDALVSRNGFKLDSLPEGAVVGTSSLRRRAQLLAYRPDLQIEDLRGNVDTRLRKLDEGLYDAIVLASAGLKRLGFAERIEEFIAPEISLPAVGQGAVGIEIRSDDRDIKEVLTCFHAPEVYQSVLAERSFLRVLEGGCQIPIGALARVKEGQLTVQGVVAGLDGKTVIREAISGSAAEAEALGRQLAEAVLARGAGKILDQLREAK